MQRGEELAGQERTEMVGRKNEPEDGGQTEAGIAPHDQAPGERRRYGAAQTQSDVDQVHGDADAQQSGGPRQPGPRPDIEMRDHTDHGDGDDPELPAGQALAPNGTFEHDGD